MMNRIGRVLPAVALILMGAVAALSVASAHINPARSIRAVAPPLSQRGENYLWNGVNSSDIIGLNGQTTLKTASLAGLVANTPVNIIPAVAGKQIVVVGYNVSSNVAASTVTFQDETGTPIVFDGCTFAANDHIQVFRGGMPLITTGVGAALDEAITGTSDVVKGSVTYYYQ